MPAAPVIQVKDVSLMSRKGSLALDQVSLQVDAGDFITIIGPNGAGKSVLLKCILGLLRPDSGAVIRRPGLRVGYIPQKMAVERSIPINVQQFLRLARKAPPAELLARTGVADILQTPLRALSGGEIQRVLLTRALAAEPELLVLDEPAQNLDISGQSRLYQLLEEIHRERGIGILMVSHDLHLVMASSRKVICLFHHICCSGEPQAVSQDPKFLSLFGDDFHRLMAVYSHQHGHDHQH